jgi:PEGA domain
MRSLRWPLAVVAALAAGPARAGASRIAVVTLDAPPELQFTGKSVAEALAKEAAKAGFEVVGPGAVAEKLGPAGHAELVRCGDDGPCLAHRGAKLGVDRIVAGWLRKRGTAYRVALVHADAKTGERLGGLEREIPVASRRLQKDLAAAAPALLAGGEDTTGILRVTTDVPGAQVTVDDVVVGRTPVARAVKPGKHKVKVSLDGYADAEPVWIDVEASAIVEHRPRIYRIPARERPNASPTEGHGSAVELVK